MPNLFVNQIATRAPEMIQKTGATGFGVSGVVWVIESHATFFTAMGTLISSALLVWSFFWNRKLAKAKEKREIEIHKAKLAQLNSSND